MTSFNHLFQDSHAGHARLGYQCKVLVVSLIVSSIIFMHVHICSSEHSFLSPSSSYGLHGTFKLNGCYIRGWLGLHQTLFISQLTLPQLQLVGWHGTGPRFV